MENPKPDLGGHTAAKISLKLLRLKQMKATTGLCKSQIYALAKTPNFPQRVKLGTRAVGYLEHEVQAWIESRVKASRGNAGGAQ